MARGDWVRAAVVSGVAPFAGEGERVALRVTISDIIVKTVRGWEWSRHQPRNNPSRVTRGIPLLQEWAMEA